MGAMSNFLECKLIDQLFRSTNYSFPTTVYVGLILSSGAPSDSSAGTEVATTDTNYSRVAVPATYQYWTRTNGDSVNSASDPTTGGTTGTTTNVQNVTFPAPTGINNWGTIGYFGIYDAASAGNLLFYGALSTPKTVNKDDAAPYFAPGQLSIQIDN